MTAQSGAHQKEDQKNEKKAYGCAGNGTERTADGSVCRPDLLLVSENPSDPGTVAEQKEGGRNADHGVYDLFHDLTDGAWDHRPEPLEKAPDHAENRSDQKAGCQHL